MKSFMQNFSALRFRRVTAAVALLFLVTFDSFGQALLNQQVHINPSTLNVKEILKQIESQSDIGFVYSRALTSIDHVITLKNDKTTIANLLKQISDATKLNFLPDGRQVVVREASRPVEVPATPRKISGTVSEAGTGERLQGVSVYSRRNGTVTDSLGNFSLSASTGDTLIFSFVGMISRKITVQAEDTHLKVALEQNLNELNQLIVTGYQTQKKADLTGAVTVVNMDDIRNNATGNALNMLQGRVAGLNITSSGDPSGAVTVRIRGIGTLGDNNPLYIIDGVPSKRGLHEINHQDIESIQVLKDASSSTIYGARASNGVIIITTRKGKKQGNRVDVNISGTFQKFVSKPAMLNTQGRGQALWQASINDKSDPNNQSLYRFDWNGDMNNPVLNSIHSYEYLDDATTIKPADTDWYDEITRSSFSQDYNVSFSRGTEKGSHLFSVGYLNNQGTIRNTFSKKLSARLNSDYEFLNGRIKVGENLALSTRNYYEERVYEQYTSALYSALMMPSLIPVRGEDGRYGGPVASVNDYFNPVFLTDKDKGNRNDFYRVLGNVYADIDILTGLRFHTSLGLEATGYTGRYLERSYDQGFLNTTETQVTSASQSERSIVFSNTLNYSKDISRHRLEALLGHEQISYQTESFGAGRTAVALENMDYAYLSSASGMLSNYGTGARNALLSFFGKINYVYDGKYLLSAVLRRDGSSRFGQENRFGNFPAFSAGWRISRENFLQNIDALSDLKFRYGWGRTGNQEIGDNGAFTLYGSNYDNTSYDIGGVNSGTLPSGFVRTQVGNPRLKWETVEQSNLGVDFGFFNNRLSGSFDYYVKNTYDILIKPPTLAVSGEGAAQWFNGASMKNTGYEFVLTYSGEFGRKGFYQFSGNIGSYKNKVTYLPAEVLTAYPGNGTDQVILGRSINSYFDYVTEGLFQNEAEVEAHAKQPGAGIGRIRYKDLDQNGVIDANDRTYIGVSDPDFSYGLQAKGGYGKFDLTLFFQGVHGNSVYNSSRTFTDFSSYRTGSNWGQRTLQAWTPENRDSDIPALTLVDRNNETRSSTYFVDPGSYLKLRNIELGYQFESLFKGSRAVRLYLQARNVFLVKSKHFAGPDPEVISAGYGYPQPFHLTTGLNIGI